MVEAFVNTYRKCPCCGYSLHVYMYPYADKAHTKRYFRQCIACKRDCRGAKKCKVGTMA